MALMRFREGDQARWVGIRPGHRGTQVIKNIDVINGTQELIDGTQTTITYLTAFSIGIMRNKDGVAQLFVTNNGDVLQYYLAYVQTYTTDPGNTFGLGLNFPIEIPAGYKVKAESIGVGVIVRGFIHGWEE